MAETHHAVSGQPCLQVYCWHDATYEGEVSGGLRHGYGRLTIANSPVVYEGHWQHSKRCGRGVLYYTADKTAYYDGTLFRRLLSLLADNTVCIHRLLNALE